MVLMPSFQTAMAIMSPRTRCRSLASSMIWPVFLIPSFPETSCRRGDLDHTSSTSFSLTSFFRSTTMQCRCMSVVGVTTAMVCMSSPCMTVFTSGPWWVGNLREGSMALRAAPFLSAGSAPRRIREAKTFWIPKACCSGYSVRTSPVVLQETTLAEDAPQASW